MVVNGRVIRRYMLLDERPVTHHTVLVSGEEALT